MEHLVDMPKVFTKEEMPVTNEHIPKQQEIKKWAHLTGINVPDIDSDIGIMIGNNVLDAYSPFELATFPVIVVVMNYACTSPLVVCFYSEIPVHSFGHPS
jgi:hypothetical protein